MKKIDRVLVNDVANYLSSMNGYAPAKKSVAILCNCWDCVDYDFRHALCKINNVVYMFKYFDKPLDQHMYIVLQRDEFNAFLCTDIIKEIIEHYGYERGTEYLRYIIACLEDTVEKIFCNEMKNAFESFKRREIFEQFGYSSVDDIKNEIEAEEDDVIDAENIEASHMMEISKECTEDIYKSGDSVMSNTFFAARVCEYFNCESKEVSGVYTYCPLRSYPVCEANAYCGIDSAIFKYSGIYYAAFHVRNDVYELHRIDAVTYDNIARIMLYDVYPRTTRWIVRTNLNVRAGQYLMVRENIMDMCMESYRKKIHETRELEY